MTATDFRPMGLHERYSLMRQNAGYPHTILYAISYPPASLPTRTFLSQRVADLQARLPLLSARLKYTHTTKPGYVPGPPWAAGDIVRDEALEHDDALESVYKREMARFAAQDFDGDGAAPLWAITRVIAPSRCYLLIAWNHLVADGRGTTRLLALLTSPTLDIPVEKWDVTRMDDTVRLAPSLRFLLPVVGRELLLPRLPLFLQTRLTSADPWPGPCPSPLSALEDMLLLSLPPDTVSALKTAGKARGVHTLHPLLKTAYLCAMWAVFGAGPDLRLAAGTARDERDPTKGHSAATHNYVSSVEWEGTVSGSEGVWDTARGMARLVSSPAGVAAGRMTMGLLAYIPDPAVDPATCDPKCPTGWERHFVGRARSANPYRDSMAMSNLGAISLPLGAEDAMWGQTASPFASAYMVNVLGHEGGVRISSAWREGCAADRAETERVHAVLRRVVERMASGEEGSVAEMTRE